MGDRARGASGQGDERLTFDIVTGAADRSSSEEGGPSGGDEGGGASTWAWWVLGLIVLIGGVAAILTYLPVGGEGGFPADTGGDRGGFLADTGGDRADYRGLEVTITGTPSADGTAFSIELIGYGEDDEVIPGEEIANPGVVHYLVSTSEIEPPARGDSRWETCSVVDCSFQTGGSPHVYVAWDREPGEPELLSTNVWLDLSAGATRTWAPPGEWAFEEDWTGTHTWSVWKAIPIETIPFEDLTFVPVNATYKEETCESDIPEYDEACLRVKVEVTSNAATAAELPSLRWEASYSNQNDTRWLPFVREPRGDLEPDETTIITVGVPVGSEDEPQALQVSQGGEDVEPVHLDIAEIWAAVER